MSQRVATSRLKNTAGVKKRGRMAANVVCKGVSKGFSAALGPRDVTPVVRSKDLSNDFFWGQFY